MRNRIALTAVAILFAISVVRSQPSIQDGDESDCRKLPATAPPRPNVDDFLPSSRERLASILDPRTEARLQILRLFRSFEDVTFEAPKFSVAPWKVAEFEDEREVEKRQKTWMYGRSEWWSHKRDFAKHICEVTTRVRDFQKVDLACLALQDDDPYALEFAFWQQAIAEESLRPQVPDRNGSVLRSTRPCKPYEYHVAGIWSFDRLLTLPDSSSAEAGMLCRQVNPLLQPLRAPIHVTTFKF